MPFYRVTVNPGQHFIRQAGNLKAATSRATIEHGEGVVTVALMSPAELAEHASRGYPLPPAARAPVAAWRALQAAWRQKVRKARARREKAAERSRQSFNQSRRS